MSPSHIKGVRNKLRLSQSRFAKKIRYARITLALWETGKLKPGPDAVKAIRAAAAKT